MLTEEARQLLQTLREEKRRDQHAKTVSIIRSILRQNKITQVELSIAMGLWTPPRGKKGSSVISLWLGEHQRPGPKKVITLQLLEIGILRLVEKGRDGQRRLYDVELTPPHNKENDDQSDH